jgi:hypothetical protein
MYIFFPKLTVIVVIFLFGDWLNFFLKIGRSNYELRPRLFTQQPIYGDSNLIIMAIT